MGYRNNTILYFEQSDGKNIAIRADEITGIGTYGGKSTKISVFFEGVNNVNGGEIRLEAVSSASDKSVVKAIVDAINNPKVKYVDVVNPTTNRFVHTALSSVSDILVNNQNYQPDRSFSEQDIDAQSATLTASNILKGIIRHTSTTGPGVITFPNATTIKEAFTPNLNSFDTVELYYVNDGNQNVTFAVDGTTVFLRNGSSPTIAANSGCKILMEVVGIYIYIYVLG